MVKIRPDFAFFIAVDAYFAKNPSHSHYKVIKTILYYLKRSINCGIIYCKEKNLIIKRYLDSNWTYDKKSCKSTSDFIFMLNSGLVNWWSKRQSMVVLFFTKAEYIALIFAAKKAT